MNLGGDTFTSVPGATRRIRAALQAELRRAEEAAGRQGVWLELFSGSARVARRLKKISKHGAIAFDIRNGLHFDLTNRTVQQMIFGWVKSGRVLGILAAFPCTTWSNARRPALRTPAALRGLSHMLEDPRTRAQIEAGNRTLDFAAKLGRLCERHGCLLVLENPSTSLAWQEPQLVRLAEKATVHILDQCQYGAPFRKRTRLLVLNGHPEAALERRCSGARGRCSRTGLLHASLVGGAATRPAQVYPLEFAKALAASMQRMQASAALAAWTRLA